MNRSFALLATLVALASVAEAQAPADGPALMREANALVRDGLYRAALLRYREAAAAGVDSPLFHYNLGIVQYRLNDFELAIESLRRAAADTRLAPMANYNIGLAQIALGDEAAAATTFEQVVDMGASRDLRRLARRAAERVTRERPPESRPTRRRSGNEIQSGGFRLVAVARVAQDDNVYRAPAEPYVDLSLPTQPIITPIVYSASFMPVDLLAQYAIPNEAGDTEFQFNYQMNGDFYDSEFSNANRISQKFSFGADIALQSEAGKRRSLDSAFFMRSHEETNFNPDDGLDRSLAGDDLQDRFDYRSAGTEIDYRHDLGGRWSYGFDVLLERRQFSESALLTNHDHESYFASLWTRFELNRATAIRFGVDQFRRVYDERLARDLNGGLLATNETLEYNYQAFNLGLERRIGRIFQIEVDLERLERLDEFVGYYDYTRDGVELVLSLSPNEKVRLSAEFDVGFYDYPKAFAFNEPTAGQRELDTEQFELRLEYAFSRQISLWASLEAEEHTSTDQRAEYARSFATLGVLWRRR